MDALRRAARAVWGVRAEILLAGATLAGWALVTAFIAALTSPRAWMLSAGLFCLSLAGWRYVGEMAWRGLYVLTREPPGGARGA